MNDYSNANFINDKEKMRDFKRLSKKGFLSSYSYLTEQEYDNTAEEMLDKLYSGLNKLMMNLPWNMKTAKLVGRQISKQSMNEQKN